MGQHAFECTENLKEFDEAAGFLHEMIRAVVFVAEMRLINCARFSS